MPFFRALIAPGGSYIPTPKDNGFTRRLVKNSPTSKLNTGGAVLIKPI